ncbi:Aste57867_361 [Aphanomyces stellatus]|uniref:Pre-mRNA-splicing factor 18 n=1 Tax=Aphanomyces stellatus TaxID=120398 RepID=A0A485K5J1_9STRA|nr:hypothetical protein As57867_000360 [Aphanomyces stellatus]VFT77587.1 Aste57867_361 [Aphanomyces stellatus]
MDQIQATMAALKRQREEAKSIALKNSDVPVQKKKYMRRGEIEAAIEEEERKNAPAPTPTQAEDDEKAETEKESVVDASSTQTKKDVAALSSSSEPQDAKGQLNLSLSEIKKRLRNLGHPVTLFGETPQGRQNRLESLIHATEGGEMNLQETKDDKEAEGEENKEERSDEMLVYRYFKSMLSMWEQALGQRPEGVKRTAQGKIATQTMKQCKDYIRPLFRMCKHHEVPPEILTNLLDIVRFCEAGEFVQANDAYIKMAIGNAAWPIGVTMVGIHERTGREKINSNKQAHVMNNELQRKYLTSVKRLVSYAQSISNVLPSKKVL